MYEVSSSISFASEVRLRGSYVRFFRNGLAQRSLADDARFEKLDADAQRTIEAVIATKSSVEAEFLQQFQALKTEQKVQFSELGRIAIMQQYAVKMMSFSTQQTIDTLLQSQVSKHRETHTRFDALDSHLDVLDARLEQGLKEYREDLVYEDGEKRRARVQVSILESLRFPQMQDRYEAIASAHKKTFTWIFKDPVKHQRPWSSFSDWLTNGSGLYWVQGKAASGKSVLMRFIWRHPSTMRGLETWAQGSHLKTSSFYFWNSGFQQQRSQAGLFRTLLYEMLKDDEHLLPKVFPEEWARNSRLAAHDMEMGQESWSSLGRLKDAFTNLVRLASPQRRFCFFIDGLDEYEGDPADVAEYIEETSRMSPFAKFCVSSRPWPTFLSIFEGIPGLRLQDLTKDDIHRFVHDKFGADRSMQGLVRHEPENAQWLVREITTRASGVFLWVFLVVKSLLNGLRNGDDMRCLHRRLFALPMDLENLYSHMLSQIEPENLEESSRIFQVFRKNGNTLRVMFLQQILMCSDLQSAIQLPTTPLHNLRSTFRKDRTKRLIDMTRLRLNSRCRGLFEVGDSLEDEDFTLYEPAQIAGINSGVLNVTPCSAPSPDPIPPPSPTPT